MKNRIFQKRTLFSLLAVVGISIVIIIVLVSAVKTDPTVKTEAAEIKSVASVIQADGSITPQNQATLRFQTGGKLVYLPFKEGDSVKQGQTIASLDTTTLQKQLTQSLNTYRSTRNTFDQTEQNEDKSVLQNQQKTVTGLSDAGYLNDVAKRIVDQNQANLDNSVLNVEIAQQAIYLSTITSPLNGIITHMDVTSSGVNVTPTTTFIVADPSTLVFRANILENDIDFVTEGSTVTIKLGSGNGKAIQGIVSKIYPDKIALSTGQKAYQVDIESTEIDQYGKMGQSGTALIQSNSQNAAKLVPTWTVLNHDSLWVFANGKPVLRSVIVGKTHGNMTEILDGLEANDRVITNPESIAAGKYQIL